jgi:hypothetical protein
MLSGGEAHVSGTAPSCPVRTVAWRRVPEASARSELLTNIGINNVLLLLESHRLLLLSTAFPYPLFNVAARRRQAASRRWPVCTPAPPPPRRRAWKSAAACQAPVSRRLFCARRSKVSEICSQFCPLPVHCCSLEATSSQSEVVERDSGHQNDEQEE